MNKREFVAGGMACAVAAPALAQSADATATATSAPGPLRALLTRTQRLPDLAEQAGADTFEAYVGERFDVVAGAGTGQALILASVERVARCARTEQFNVAFAPDGGPVAATDGVRVLAHATGQRLALHLEHGPAGYVARLNLLA